MSSESFLPPGARNQTDVFAVHGADPEILALSLIHIFLIDAADRVADTNLNPP